MITKQDDLLGTLVHDVAHLLRLDIDRRMAGHNLTRVKWLALGIIARRPGLTQADLAGELELGGAAVGRLIDRLEERGFVARAPDPRDRRAHRLEVKPEAAKLIAELSGMTDDLKHNALQGLSTTELSALQAGLNKIKKNLRRSAVSASAAIGVLLPKLYADLVEAQSLAFASLI